MNASMEKNLFKLFLGPLLAVLACIVLNVAFFTPHAYAAVPSMKIYAISLGSTGSDEADSKGDSVLMESDGKYLLMDIGRNMHAPYVVDQVKALGATSIDLYFSHVHCDHVGAVADGEYLAGLNYLADSGVKVDKLYMPDKDLYVNTREVYKTSYDNIVDFAKDHGWEIEYLRLGSTFSVGDVSAEVIGPLDEIVSRRHTFYFLDGEGNLDLATSTKSRYLRLENDLSLVTIFTCGNTKYFTAGDLLEDGAALYEYKYEFSDKLDCDIMKLSHHGTIEGSPSKLLSLVSPSYSFCLNTTYTEATVKSNGSMRWRTYSTVSRAKKHGLVYQVGSERKTILYDVYDGNSKGIRMYTARKDNTPVTDQTGLPLDGWVRLVGGDGDVRSYDVYYIKDGVPVTGVNEVNGRYYYFKSNGEMEFGSRTDLCGWDSSEKNRNYSTKSVKIPCVKAGGLQKTKLAVMATGFKWVADAEAGNAGKQVGSFKRNASLYYFLTTHMTSDAGKIGAKLTVSPTGTEFAVKKIKTGKSRYKYLINESGKIKTSFSRKHLAWTDMKKVRYFMNIKGEVKKQVKFKSKSKSKAKSKSSAKSKAKSKSK